MKYNNLNHLYYLKKKKKFYFVRHLPKFWFVLNNLDPNPGAGKFGTCASRARCRQSKVNQSGCRDGWPGTIEDVKLAVMTSPIHFWSTYVYRSTQMILSISDHRLDGSLEHGAQIWSKPGISICSKHLVTSDFFLGKSLFYFIRAPHVPIYHEEHW